MLECLNRSVMYLDSLPEYVNVDHFCLLSVVGGRVGGVWVSAGCGGGLGLGNTQLSDSYTIDSTPTF